MLQTEKQGGADFLPVNLQQIRFGKTMCLELKMQQLRCVWVS